jgi:hypothetical protein
VFTILPTIEDADTTCPKDTTASSGNKSGLPGTPASPGPSGPPGRGRVTRTSGPSGPAGPGTRQALSRRWSSSTGSLRRRHGHHPDQLRQQRSVSAFAPAHHTNHYRLNSTNSGDWPRCAHGTARRPRPGRGPRRQRSTDLVIVAGVWRGQALLWVGEGGGRSPLTPGMTWPGRRPGIHGSRYTIEHPFEDGVHRDRTMSRAAAWKLLLSRLCCGLA